MSNQENDINGQLYNLTLTETLTKELTESTLDLSKDYGEVLIDSFLGSDSLISDIPILSTVTGGYKIIKSIQNAHFIKKLHVFLKEFHTGCIDSQKLKKFKDKLNLNTKYREKVIEHLVIYVERVESISKAEILAKLLNAHVNNYFDWNIYTNLSASIDRLHPFAISELLQAYPTNITYLEGKDFFEPFQASGKGYRAALNSITLQQLTSTGFGIEEDLTYSDSTTSPPKTNLQFSSLGYYFITHALDYKKSKVNVINHHQVQQAQFIIDAPQSLPKNDASI